MKENIRFFEIYEINYHFFSTFYIQSNYRKKKNFFFSKNIHTYIYIFFYIDILTNVY